VSEKVVLLLFRYQNFLEYSGDWVRIWMNPVGWLWP